MTLARRVNEKLSSRFYGPFKIIAKVGPAAYRLQLSENTKIHPIFHVSFLKRAFGSFLPQLSLPQQLNDELELLVEPKSVLEVHPKFTFPTLWSGCFNQVERPALV